MYLTIARREFVLDDRSITSRMNAFQNGFNNIRLALASILSRVFGTPITMGAKIPVFVEERRPFNLNRNRNERLYPGPTGFVTQTRIIYFDPEALVMPGTDNAILMRLFSSSTPADSALVITKAQPEATASPEKPTL